MCWNSTVIAVILIRPTPNRTSEVNLVNDSSGSEECVWSPRTFGIRAQQVNIGSLFKLIRRRLFQTRNLEHHRCPNSQLPLCDPKPGDLGLDKLKIRFVTHLEGWICACSKKLEWSRLGGEMPIELGNSWLSAKPMFVGYHLSLERSCLSAYC